MSGTAALEIVMHSIKQLLLQHVESSSSSSSCSSHPLLLLQWEFNTGSHCRSEGIYEASALVLYTKNAPPRSRLPRSVAQMASPGTPVTAYNTWTNRKAHFQDFKKGMDNWLQWASCLWSKLQSTTVHNGTCRLCRKTERNENKQQLLTSCVGVASFWPFLGRVDGTAHSQCHHVRAPWCSEAGKSTCSGIDYSHWPDT
jgi:hypothetical protein